MQPKKNRNVFFIGLLSFFGGISQDMFVPILPLYLSNILGLDKAFIGISEGLVTAGASLFKVISGFFVDRYGKKKPFVFLGYFFSLVARPLLAFTTSAMFVFGLRFFDGVGKGMKDSPKDVLIADSTEQKTRGRGFGVARMLDTLGSVVGPILLFVLLYVWRNHPQQYHLILIITALPLAVTLFVLQRFVVETSQIENSPAELTREKLPMTFYLFLAMSLLFGIGNSSDAFLILRAQNVGVSLLAIPIVYALFNFVYASASIPLGSLSDRIGRERVIIIGWLAFALSYAGFAFATETYQIWLLFVFYGLYYATTYGVAKAYVADLVPAAYRGRAYGIYNTAIGLVALPASYIAGELWDRVNPSIPFLFGAILALGSIILLAIFSFVRKHAKLQLT